MTKNEIRSFAARVPLRMLEAPRAATVLALGGAGGLAAAGSRDVMDVPVAGGTPMPANEADALNRALIEYHRQRAGQQR